MTYPYDVRTHRKVQIAVASTAAGRVAAGVAAFARPERLPRLLGLDRGTARRGAVLVRFGAAREIGLGLGTLWALRTGRDVTPWLLAGVIADAGDAAAVVSAARDRAVPMVRGGAVAVAAVSGVLGAALALRALRR
jgi:hypothetical protein